MKIAWKKKTPDKTGGGVGIPRRFPNLPFDDDVNDDQSDVPTPTPTPSSPSSTNSKTLEQNSIATSPKHPSSDTTTTSIANSFIEQGNRLAEEGRYGEALGKWETAITLMPEKAVLHEQKAQVLLEIGDAWGALKAATLATELDPSWAEGWVTLGRAQLNFGEPDVAIESFDKALGIKGDLRDVMADRQVASQLVKRRKELLQSSQSGSGVGVNSSRFVVGEKQGSSSVGGE